MSPNLSLLLLDWTLFDLSTSTNEKFLLSIDKNFGFDYPLKTLFTYKRIKTKHEHDIVCLFTLKRVQNGRFQAQNSKCVFGKLLSSRVIKK